jgi:hypothetical protein
MVIPVCAFVLKVHPENVPIFMVFRGILEIEIG